MTLPVSPPHQIPAGLAPEPGFCIKTRTTADSVVPVLGAPSPSPVPRGTKVFLNVAWLAAVPPPPNTDRARAAVPLAVSDARPDTDKAGQPVLVFDAVFNPALKPLAARDPDLKSFLIELALQQIEARTPLVLSRQIGTPNIASKGVPRPRPRIEELPAWTCTRDGPHRRITVHVPDLTRALLPRATLDVEPRRIALHVPPLYALDIDIDIDDGRALDVDGARAEWRVAEGVIVLYA